MKPREQPDEVGLMAVLKRKNRVDQIMANACFTLLNLQPLGKKGFERIHRRAVRHIARRRDAEHVVAEQPAEPEAQAVFDNERDRPDRRAPKGKRILGAGWLFSDDVERSEEHTSELQSLMRISYAVFCLKQKTVPSSTLTHAY